MTSLIDLQYEVDEMRQDVRDLDGGQEQLTKRLDRLEEKIGTLFLEAVEKHIRPLFNENQEEIGRLREVAERTLLLEEMVKHLARNVGTSPMAAGAYVLDVLTT